LLFSNSKGLIKGLAIDLGQIPVIFHPALMFLAEKASFLAF